MVNLLGQIGGFIGLHALRPGREHNLWASLAVELPKNCLGVIARVGTRAVREQVFAKTGEKIVALPRAVENEISVRQSEREASILRHVELLGQELLKHNLANTSLVRPLAAPEQVRCCIDIVDFPALDFASRIAMVQAMRHTGTGFPFRNEQQVHNTPVLTPEQAVTLLSPKKNTSSLGYAFKHVLSDDGAPGSLQAKSEEPRQEQEGVLTGEQQGMLKLVSLPHGGISSDDNCDYCQHDPGGGFSCRTKHEAAFMSCRFHHCMCLQSYAAKVSTTTRTLVCPVCKIMDLPPVGFISVDATDGYSVSRDSSAIVVGSESQYRVMCDEFDSIDGGDNHIGMKTPGFSEIKDRLTATRKRDASEHDEKELKRFRAEHPHLGIAGDVMFDARADASNSKLLEVVKLAVRLKRDRGAALKLVIIALEEPTLAALSAIWFQLLATEGFNDKNTMFLDNGPREKLSQQLEDFHTKQDVTVCLYPFNTSATGINLTAANELIIFAPHEIPAKEAQAVARVIRMGSKHEEVNIHRFYMEGTIEEMRHSKVINHRH